MGFVSFADGPMDSHLELSLHGHGVALLHILVVARPGCGPSTKTLHQAGGMHLHTDASSQTPVSSMLVMDDKTYEFHGHHNMLEHAPFMLISDGRMAMLLRAVLGNGCLGDRSDLKKFVL